MSRAVRSISCLNIAIFNIVLLGSMMSAQTLSDPAKSASQSNPPTAAEAAEFIQKAEARLGDVSVKASRAAWVQSNFITDDTEQMAAEANEGYIAAATELAKQAKRYDNVKLSPELSRKMLLLKLSVGTPAPTIPKSWRR